MMRVELMAIAMLTGLVANASFSDGSDIRRGRPVVQVRDFPSASTVSVLGWDGDQSAFGLRAEVNRQGALVGGARRGDHVLYVGSSYAETRGGFTRALLLPGTMLARMSAVTDRDACHGNTPCSPLTTVRVGMPDKALRAHGDSMVVMFYPNGASNWGVTLRKELLDEYLRVVDSVTTALQKK